MDDQQQPPLFLGVTDPASLPESSADIWVQLFNRGEAPYEFNEDAVYALRDWFTRATDIVKYVEDWLSEFAPFAHQIKRAKLLYARERARAYTQRVRRPQIERQRRLMEQYGSSYRLPRY